MRKMLKKKKASGSDKPRLLSLKTESAILQKQSVKLIIWTANRVNLIMPLSPAITECYLVVEYCFRDSGQHFVIVDKHK